MENNCNILETCVLSHNLVTFKTWAWGECEAFIFLVKDHIAAKDVPRWVTKWKTLLQPCRCNDTELCTNSCARCLGHSPNSGVFLAASLLICVPVRALDASMKFHIEAYPAWSPKSRAISSRLCKEDPNTIAEDSPAQFLYLSDEPMRCQWLAIPMCPTSGGMATLKAASSHPLKNTLLAFPTEVWQRGPPLNYTAFLLLSHAHYKLLCPRSRDWGSLEGFLWHDFWSCTFKVPFEQKFETKTL